MDTIDTGIMQTAPPTDFDSVFFFFILLFFVLGCVALGLLKNKNKY